MDRPGPKSTLGPWYSIVRRYFESGIKRRILKQPCSEQSLEVCMQRTRVPTQAYFMPLFTTFLQRFQILGCRVHSATVSSTHRILTSSSKATFRYPNDRKQASEKRSGRLVKSSPRILSTTAQRFRWVCLHHVTARSANSIMTSFDQKYFGATFLRSALFC